MKSLTFGSLFAGIGGLDLGLERAGLECKWQVEIDDYATKVLEKHWPGVRRWRDITTFPPDSDSDQLRDQPGRSSGEGGADQTEPADDGDNWAVDLICGGFPCQDISFAGKGAGLSGERSGLFYELVRVVGLIRPQFVLLENVAALLARGLDDVLGTLASLGYDAEWHCIPAAAVGAPHIRDRVFILGHANDQGQPTQPVNGEAPRLSEVGDTNGHRLEKPGIFQSEFCVAETSFWSTEPDVGRVADGVSRRVDRLRGLGNAVVPQVAEYIGRRTRWRQRYD